MCEHCRLVHEHNREVSTIDRLAARAGLRSQRSMRGRASVPTRKRRSRPYTTHMREQDIATLRETGLLRERLLVNDLWIEYPAETHEALIDLLE